MNNKRIVITGLGVVSPIGIGKDAFWQGLKEGCSGIKPVTLFDTKGLKMNFAGEITHFKPKEILTKVNLMDLDRATLILNSAAKLALQDAELEITEANTDSIGVSIGTTFGSLHSISAFDREAINEGPRYANPSVFTSTVGNSPASRISIIFKIKGFNSTISTGMCAALDALEYACNLIKLGKAKTVIAGGVEALSQQIFLGFYKLRYLAGLKPNSIAISAPFDKRRNGIIPAEGSAVFVLEDLESARNHKAKVYAEILGAGSSFDPSKFYRYDPEAKGMKKAMKLALEDAQIKPQEIDCVFANANSTKHADLYEAGALKEVFGEYAQKIPVTSVKSMCGETYSASGAMSLAAGLCALTKDFIPPTINLDKPDPACGLNVFNKTLSKKSSKIMVNTFGPNGNNTVLILGEYKDGRN